MWELEGSSKGVEGMREREIWRGLGDFIGSVCSFWSSVGVVVGGEEEGLGQHQQHALN